jgi:glycosyltransferase involved in cell wall biosynthesis
LSVNHLNSTERPLRIGFLTSEYPTEAYSGGIGSYVRQMAHSLAELGHSVFVLLAVSEGETITWDGPVPIHRVPLSALAARLPEPLTRLSNFIFARRLAGAAKGLELDVLEAPEFEGLTAFLDLVKPRGLHVVVRLHTCSAICRSLANQRPASTRIRLTHRLQDWLETRAIETADSVTAISNATVALTKTTLRVKRDDFHVTPNPVNELFFSPAGATEFSGEPLVLFAGRLEWRKGPDIFVKALPQLLERFPNARFCLAGGDTNTAPGGLSGLAYLSSLIPEQARARIEFAGFLQPEQLLKKYREASVCVFPSRWEGFGLVAAEAMACGKAIVVSDAPGFRELISEGETGLFAKVEDPQGLAEAIGLLLADAQLRQTLGTAASNDMRARFRGVAVGKSILHIYREAITVA